jgi:hypothetical protein
MFKYRAPSDKFRSLEALVSILMFWLFAQIFVVIPVQRWRYEKAHPMPHWAACVPNGMTDLGDGRHFVVWSATSYSPDRRNLLIYNNPCAFTPWGSSVTLLDTEEPVTGYWEPRINNPQNVFTVRYGGVVIPMWVTNTRVRVTCFDCWPQDASETKRSVGNITVEYDFVAPKGRRPAQYDWR